MSQSNILIGFLMAFLVGGLAHAQVQRNRPTMTPPDCNGNGVPDGLDIRRGTSQDCNGNRIPDECDLASGRSQDCNGNQVPDSCDISSGDSTDLNGNAVPDDCEDCNGNGIPDDLDLASGAGEDHDGDGRIDSCQALYVDAAANPGGDGSSWSQAYRYLQDALADSIPGDMIWVAEGIYRPDEGGFEYSGDRRASFVLQPGQKIFGAFLGNEDRISLRGGSRDRTVLSGDLLDNDLPVAVTDLGSEPTRFENSYHVMTANFTDASTEIDSLTFYGGQGNGVSSADQTGAGLFLKQASPVVRDCQFLGNYSAPPNGHGAAIYNESGAAQVIDCIFDINSGNGGVVMAWNSPMVFLRSRFRDNEGTGLEVDANNYGLDPVLVNCEFKNNTDGGIQYTSRYLGAQVSGSLFHGNSTGGDGGAILLFGDANVTNRIINSTFYGNTAGNDGGGIFVPPNGALTKIENSILWSNSSTNDGFTEQGQLAWSIAFPPTVNYCDLMGWTNILGGSGNFAIDPQFVSPGSDFRLQAGSLCINGGDSQRLPADTYDLDADGNTVEALPLDLGGGVRVQGGQVDQGCYENL